MMQQENKSCCAWSGSDARMLHYHDEEWGVPVHDDRKWFEYLVLDAFQAGLSWKTVLHKRDAFRKVFHDFDPGRVARMTAAEVEKAMGNPAIIRNRQKINAAVNNARAFLEFQTKQGSFDAFIWSFTNGVVIQNTWRAQEESPASTPLSDAVSKAMEKEGFSFAGTNICYAFLQAGGVVNDHLVDCFRYRDLQGR